MLSPPEPRRRVLWARRSCLQGLLLALATCTPGPLDVTGKLCSAERPCPTGWVCTAAVAGTCQPPRPVNALANGGFESGVAGWTASHGTVSGADGGRTSDFSALWKPDGTGDSVLTPISPPVSGPASGVWWCAQAWVLGSDGAPVELELVDNGESLDPVPVQPTAGVWRRVETVSTASGPTLSVALRSPADAGARTLSVDDLALWQNADTDCSKPP